MTDVYCLAADGTRLFAQDCGPRDSPLTTLLCLPGLTRNAKDFAPVVAQFASARRVLAMDFRGRGRSGYAADPMSYRPEIELADVIAVLDHLGLIRVAVLGTSRGGIVGMLMAALFPQRIAGLCLNDIGPRVEVPGLLRILGYVGKPVRHATWQDAAQALAASSHGFAHVSDQQWLAFAKRVFIENDGAIIADCDPNLAVTMTSREDIAAGKVPDLWGLVPTLSAVPLALLRGANSDLLSPATAARLKHEIPHLDWTEIPDRGHVPFLDEPQSMAALARWIERVDRSDPSRPRSAAPQDEEKQ